MLQSETIVISDLEVFVHVGVPEHERSKPQALWLDLELSTPKRFQDMDDDLSATTDYALVACEAESLAVSKEWRLIETLAAQLALLLKERFCALSGMVAVKKKILPNARLVAVTIKWNDIESKKSLLPVPLND